MLYIFSLIAGPTTFYSEFFLRGYRRIGIRREITPIDGLFVRNTLKNFCADFFFQFDG